MHTQTHTQAHELENGASDIYFVVAFVQEQ